MNSRIIRYGDGDRFFILASRGFWEIMTVEEAVSIVKIVKRQSRRVCLFNLFFFFFHSYYD
jgi:serine/threonine protein phosphatase PrpC